MILRCHLFLLVFFTSAFAQATEQKHSGSDIAGAPANKLAVVATIRPVHSLLSYIMQGSGKPILLLDQTQSVHHYSLRPSQRRTLAHADMIFWIGEALEGFMPRVLNSMPKRIQVIELINTKGLRLLEPRSVPASKTLHNDHEHGHHNETLDPHIWLSIDNALILAAKMTASLSVKNPAQQTLYQNNLKKLTSRLTKEKTKIIQQFNKVNFKYLVYHDAFQYFEEQVNIAPLAAISTDEEHAPGIRHLMQINKLIANNKINCLIYNTPTLPAITRNLVNNDMRKVYIDPVAQNFKAGPELYFNLLNSLADGYQQCK